MTWVILAPALGVQTEERTDETLLIGLSRFVHYANLFMNFEFSKTE